MLLMESIIMENKSKVYSVCVEMCIFSNAAQIHLFWSMTMLTTLVYNFQQTRFLQRFAENGNWK